MGLIKRRRIKNMVFFYRIKHSKNNVPNRTITAVKHASEKYRDII